MCHFRLVDRYCEMCWHVLNNDGSETFEDGTPKLEYARNRSGCTQDCPAYPENVVGIFTRMASREKCQFCRFGVDWVYYDSGRDVERFPIIRYRSKIPSWNSLLDWENDQVVVRVPPFDPEDEPSPWGEDIGGHQAYMGAAGQEQAWRAAGTQHLRDAEQDAAAKNDPWLQEKYKEQAAWALEEQLAQAEAAAQEEEQAQQFQQEEQAEAPQAELQPEEYQPLFDENGNPLQWEEPRDELEEALDEYYAREHTP